MPRLSILPVFDNSQPSKARREATHYYFLLPGRGLTELRDLTLAIPLSDSPQATRVSPDQTMILLNYNRHDVAVDELKDLEQYVAALGGRRVPYFAVDESRENVQGIGRGWDVYENAGTPRVRI